MLPYHFNWRILSAMAGVTWWNFYFRLFPGAIRSAQVIEFLTHLLRHVPGKLLIIWQSDGFKRDVSRSKTEWHTRFTMKMRSARTVRSTPERCAISLVGLVRMP